MLIYSQTILSFLSRLKVYAKEILTVEMGLIFKRDRFLHGRYLIPLHLVVFEKKNTLGFFDHHTYQIGVHKSLMYTGKTTVIKNILRHELGHLICYLKYGKSVDDHGMEYQKLCQDYGWDRDVSAATANIPQENLSLEGDLPSERIIQKVQKLLSLASSQNVHEAEAATLKANQLLLKYNLECLQEKKDFFSEEAEETIYVEQVLWSKRNSAKLHAIYEILKTFFVRPVFNYGKSRVYLEITGPKTNVEIGQYVATFLESELDRLWEQTKIQYPELRGPISKNSFMLGISQGYLKKMELIKQQQGSDDRRSMIILEKNLERKISMVYGHLSKNFSSRSFCEKSSLLGKQAGQNLSIHPGIAQKGGGKTLLLERNTP